MIYCDRHYGSHAGFVCTAEAVFCVLHLFHVILRSLLTGGEELIAVFSLSFSISPALSPPLSLKLVCGVTVNPPRPIHSSTHRIQTPCALSASQLLPQFTLSSQSRFTALNLNLAHLQSLSSFPSPLSSQSYNPLPIPSLQLHSGLHDNTLRREPLSPKAAQTASIFTPS